MKKWLIIGLFVALMLSTPLMVLADSYTCLDNATSYFSTTISVSGSAIPINYNSTCQFGCVNSTGECSTSDPMSSSVIGIALLIVAALFIVVAIKGSGGFVFHGLNIEFLQPLFITFAFMMILASFTIMISGSKASTPIYSILGSAYSTTMWVFIFFIGFLVISFIVNMLQNRLNESIKGGRK